ncbi:MAG: nucleoside triphosphate pyrophosphohydrolase [Ancalomicrobiaceae bacterium]|nr:nucleoside triphosphate pyrophosphohydrolase [Ancalomicrobiaceae bacterium]
MTPSRDISRLIEIMAALRTPVTGCPWDLEQSFRSIAPYTLEEAYEVVDAIERHDAVDLAEELGDLLLQVVFHARMAEEEGSFDFGTVVEHITRKMIRRHPHVFGDGDARTAGMVKEAWARIKAEEKAEKAAAKAALGIDAEASANSLLDDVPRVLQGLAQGVKLQERAGKVGFDWNDPKAVIDKIREELGELEAEIDAAAPHDRLEDELGDILFAVANLGRHLKVDPDAALRRTNEKFRRRFGHIEAVLGAAGRRLEDASLDEMEAIWQQAKDKV